MILVKWVECSLMAQETKVQSQVESYKKKKKRYLIPPCLTFSIIRYVSRIKWSNPGKGVAPSLTSWCSSLWKGSRWVALDYGRQLIHERDWIDIWKLLHIQYNQNWCSCRRKDCIKVLSWKRKKLFIPHLKTKKKKKSIKRCLNRKGSPPSFENTHPKKRNKKKKHFISSCSPTTLLLILYNNKSH